MNILAVLAATAWLARAPSFAALATFLSLFAILVSQELSTRRLPENADAKLFKDFLSTLPSDGLFVDFLKEQDIGAPFRRDALGEMYQFIRIWDNAEHEFKKKRFERKKKKFYDLMVEFSSELSRSIFPDSDEFYSMGINDWEDRPDKMQKRDYLNKMATKLYKFHQELVCDGKKYLV